MWSKKREDDQSLHLRRIHLIPSIFSVARGLFYDNLGATGAGLVPVAKLKAAGLDTVIASARDPQLTMGYRDQLEANGVHTWLFTDPHWYAGKFPSIWKDQNGVALPDPLLYRKQVSGDVALRLRPGDPVVLDFEKLPEAWQEEFLIGVPESAIWGWRGRFGDWTLPGTNVGRPTAFSNEPHQANPAAMYRRANAAYLDQLYASGMEDYSPWSEREWLAATGFKPGETFPIYDAFDVQPEELQPGTYLFNQDRFRPLWV